MVRNHFKELSQTHHRVYIYIYIVLLPTSTSSAQIHCTITLFSSNWFKKCL